MVDSRRVALYENRLEERLKALTQPRLPIIDEIGYIPIDRQGANLFFHLISRRYERGSVLVTSNQSLGAWGEVFGDTVIASAILDRLLHHATTIKHQGRFVSAERETPRRVTPPRRDAAISGVITRGGEFEMSFGGEFRMAVDMGLRRAALAGVIAVGLAGCGSVTEAAGRVVDPAGRPVPGALVLLRRAGQAPRDAQFAERADRTGGFHAILHGGYFPPDAVLSVCAPGFAPAERRVVGGRLAAGLAVGLRPGRGAGPLCEVPPGLAVIERGGAAAESPPPAR